VAIAIAAACVLILITVLIKDTSRQELPMADSGKETEPTPLKPVFSNQDEFTENEKNGKNEIDTIYKFSKKSDIVISQKDQKVADKVRMEEKNADSGLIVPDFPVLAENKIPLRKAGILETKIEEREYYQGKETPALNDFVLVNETAASDEPKASNVLTIDRNNIGVILREYIANAANVEYKAEKSVNGTKKMFFRIRGFSIEKK
jgi:hypothetical protein